VVPAAPLRSGPGEDFPQLASLPEGLYLDIRDARPGWVRIAAAGLVGWSDAASVIPIGDSEGSGSAGLGPALEGTNQP